MSQGIHNQKEKAMTNLTQKSTAKREAAMANITVALQQVNDLLSLPQNDSDYAELEGAKELLEMAKDRMEMFGKED
jgi:gamma-glutamyl phosphate reductase